MDDDGTPQRRLGEPYGLGRTGMARGPPMLGVGAAHGRLGQGQRGGGGWLQRSGRRTARAAQHGWGAGAARRSRGGRQSAARRGRVMRWNGGRLGDAAGRGRDGGRGDTGAEDHHDDDGAAATAAENENEIKNAAKCWRRREGRDI